MRSKVVEASVSEVKVHSCGMPKRKNPYGDVTPLQLKRHVGFEERATDEEKRAMYGKPAAWKC